MRNPILVGDRVYLRPVEKSDAEAMSKSDHIETELAMQRFRIPTSQYGWEEHLEGLHKQQPPKGIVLAVCTKEDDNFIGSVELWEIDYVNRTAETGAWINGVEFRGKGYGTEAKHLLLEYAFDYIQLHVLRSWVWEPNTRSAAALAKQGYKPSGTLLRQDVKDGIFYGAFMFDVKRDEWIEAREEWRATRKQ